MPIAYPYRMSDWYGYDQDCTSLTSFLMTNAGYAMTGRAHGACLYLDGLTTYTYYHNGSGSTPVAGDTCYSDSSGNTPVNRGSNEWTGNASGTLYQWNANSGVLQAVISCPAVSAFSSTYNTPKRNFACSVTRYNTWYHNGTGSIPTTGDTCYTNSAGTTILSAGTYGVAPSSSGTTWGKLIVNSSGVVTSNNICVI